MGRLWRPFGNLSVIILKKKMGLRPILILQGFKSHKKEALNILLFILFFNFYFVFLFSVFIALFLIRSLNIIYISPSYTLSSSLLSSYQLITFFICSGEFLTSTGFTNWTTTPLFSTSAYLITTSTS